MVKPAPFRERAGVRGNLDGAALSPERRSKPVSTFYSIGVAGSGGLRPEPHGYFHGVATRCALLALAWTLSVQGAGLPGEWRHEQHFTVSAPGLVRFNLPVETLDAARSGLEDLRLYDEEGNELPYLVDRPKPADQGRPECPVVSGIAERSDDGDYA